jgi:hypothetical protein
LAKAVRELFRRDRTAREPREQRDALIQARRRRRRLQRVGRGVGEARELLALVVEVQRGVQDRHALHDAVGQRAAQALHVEHGRHVLAQRHQRVADPGLAREHQRAEALLEPAHERQHARDHGDDHERQRDHAHRLVLGRDPVEDVEARDHHRHQRERAQRVEEEALGEDPDVPQPVPDDRDAERDREQRARRDPDRIEPLPATMNRRKSTAPPPRLTHAPKITRRMRLRRKLETTVRWLRRSRIRPSTRYVWK